MTTPPRRDTRLVFPPVNRCIYCGAKEGLTLEHIIPFSLGGIIELPESSCRRCAFITRDFEQTCARQIYGNFRMRHGIQTRHREKRPNHITVGTITGGTANIPVREYPAPLIQYKFKRANILAGLPPEIDTFEWLPYVVASDKDMKEAREKYGWDWQFSAKMVPHALGRMLAKIGHSWATALIGLDAFKPLTLDLIFGRTSNVSHTVGGSFDLPEPVPDGGHILNFEGRPIGNRYFLIVHIRLFASIQTPAYHAVVGEAQGAEHVRSLVEKLKHAQSVELSLSAPGPIPRALGI